MKQSGQCPKCSSTSIAKDLKAVDRSHHGAELDMKLASFRNPEALIFKGGVHTDLSAWMCFDCGFVELYADDPKAVKL